MSNYKVGYKEEIITPKLGCLLAGYDVIRKAEEIHDELKARVLTLRGKDNYLIVQLDLVGVDYHFIGLVKNSVSSLNFNEKNIFVSTSHTHSGPTGTMNTNEGYQKGLKQVFGEYDAEYVDYIVNKIKQAVVDAISNEDSAKLSVSRKMVNNICSNRNNKDWFYDNELISINLLRKDGKKVLLYNLSCHPTVMSSDNLSITGDFPNKTEEMLNKYDLVMFLNGSCGDISTRFTRSASTFEEVDRIGTQVSLEIRNMPEVNSYEDIEKVNSIELEIPLLVKEFDSVEHAKEKVKEKAREVEIAKSKNMDSKSLRLLESKLEGLTNNYKMALGFSDVKEIVAKVKILKVNNYNIIYIPGELFSSLGKRIKDNNSKNNIVIGYGNGYIGYIPDKFAYEVKTYETFSSPFKEGEGERLVEEILLNI